MKTRTNHYSKVCAILGAAFLMLAISPPAAAHAPTPVANIAVNQLVCLGPPHLIATGATITVTISWNVNPTAGIAVCDALPVGGVCPAAPTGATVVPVSPSPQTRGFTNNGAPICAWPGIMNLGPNVITAATVSSNP